MNRFAVDGKPLAHFEQHLFFFFGNRAIGTWADVEQQAAVLANDVNQIVHQRIRRAVFVIFDVAPRIRRHRRIGLPEQIALGGKCKPLLLLGTMSLRNTNPL